MALSIYATQGRGLTYEIQMKDVAGNPIPPDTNDIIHVTIKRSSVTVLYVDSNTPTPNGSSVTINGAVIDLRLDENDLMFSPGIYTLMVDFTDYEDAIEKKVALRGTFVLLRLS